MKTKQEYESSSSQPILPFPCEELTPQSIKSVNATILQVKDRIITVRVPSSELAGLVGKDIKINGLKTIGLHSVPSSEADNFKTDFTNALTYRITDEENTSSLKVAAVCEITWQ